MKVCCKCKVLKEFSDFHNCSRSKDGLKSSCKECHNSASVIRRMNEDVKLKDKEYYIINYEKIKKYKKEYYTINKEEILEKNKEYYNDNKDYINNRNKNYTLNNKENISKYQKNYYINNKEVLNEYKKGWFSKKYKTDNVFRLKNSISSLIRSSLKKNGFEKKSVNNEEGLISLNHYTNLQPLCGYINRNIKKDKIYYEMD